MAGWDPWGTHLRNMAMHADDGVACIVLRLGVGISQYHRRPLSPTNGYGGGQKNPAWGSVLARVRIRRVVPCVSVVLWC